MPTAIVTGATGCVGRNVVDALIADGWDVIAFVRLSSDISRLEGTNCSAYFIDNVPACELWTEMPRFDAVFHCAADLTYWPVFSREQYRTNVELTKRLVIAAHRSGVSRFIFTSTGATSLPEETVATSGYLSTKAEAERFVGLAAKMLGLDAVILRLPVVFGKYDWSNYRKLFSLVREGRLPFVLPGYMSVASAKRVGEAHVWAARHGETGRTYQVQGVMASWREIVDEIADAYQVRRPGGALSLWMTRLLARWEVCKARLTGCEPAITPGLVRLLNQPGDNSLPDGVEWVPQPHVSLAECVREYIEWESSLKG